MNIFSTCKSSCGISVYSQYLLNGLRKKIKAEIIENTEKNFKELARKAKQADIVHVQFEPGAFGGIAMLKGTSIPEFYSSLAKPKKALIVTTVHEMNECKVNGLKSFFVHFYQKHINNFALRHSDAIIVHSRQLEEFMKKKKARVFFMPHGTVKKQKQIEKEKAKKLLGLNGKKILTIFGFVEPRKQHEKIISILPELDESIVLVIAGQTVSAEQYFDYLKKIVEEKKLGKRVVFTGFVKEEAVPIILSASDLMLFPYGDIYQSGALCNLAISHHKPMLASDVAGFRELKKEFNCIEIAKENEWKRKILELLGSGEKQKLLADKTREYCGQNSWEKTAEKTIKIYEELLAQKKS